MANVKFDRKTFEKEIGKLDEKMQEKIATGIIKDKMETKHLNNKLYKLI